MKNKLIYKAMKFNNFWETPMNKLRSSKNISIIIPLYYPKHLKDVLLHVKSIEGYQEIVLVDDSGEYREQDYSFMRGFENIKIYYHENNLGRSAARNTGAACAKGDILIFMDQDMFLDPDFITRVREYYYKNKSLIFLGLRETLPFKEIPMNSEWQKPSRESDWRIQTEVIPEFIDLTVLSVGNAENGCYPHEIISIFEKSEQLTKMGIIREKTIGFWDLPSMVISHSMAINKKDYYKIGGFPEWIKGWGGEDIVLGFLACAAHIPIVISNCVSYQASHQPYSGSENAKILELHSNINKYKRWANTIEQFPKFQEQMIKSRAKQVLIY